MYCYFNKATYSGNYTYCSLPYYTPQRFLTLHLGVPPHYDVPGITMPHSRLIDHPSWQIYDRLYNKTGKDKTNQTWQARGKKNTNIKLDRQMSRRSRLLEWSDVDRSKLDYPLLLQQSALSPDGDSTSPLLHITPLLRLLYRILGLRETCSLAVSHLLTAAHRQ